MEAKDIRIGRVYEIKVGKNIVPIRIMKKGEKSGWEAVGLSTNNPMLIQSEKRILRPHNPKAHKAKQTSGETPTEAPKPVSALDAAVKVLTEAGTPLNCKQMIETMLAKNYWKPAHSGKTPANTLHAAISKEIKVKAEKSRFQKAGKGLFTLNIQQ